jgi:tetraacyldisaccharide 4'-kinase
MFSKLPGGPWRFLLLPFSLLYWLGIGIRNWLYDRHILKSSAFGLPLVCVGNLAAGGTGKSPMVEYLVDKLRTKFRVATLSRGYKRKTQGYALANPSTTALEIGDEPMQFHLKFPEIPVAVGESRLEAIPQLLHDRPETEIIILDDAFQHRSIRAGLNILLTEREQLFTRDFFLPVGTLRDQKKSARRAQVIIVTKCDPEMDQQEREIVIRELSPVRGQVVFFTTLDYGQLFHIIHRDQALLNSGLSVLLVTGIANPIPLQRFITNASGRVETMHYSDHHLYTIDDLREIKKRFEKLEGDHKIIVSTEKDAVRLYKFQSELENLPVYIIPVRHRFLFNEEEGFLGTICDFAEKKAINDQGK